MGGTSQPTTAHTPKEECRSELDVGRRAKKDAGRARLTLGRRWSAHHRVAATELPFPTAGAAGPPL
jgi:hypothetical protein